MTSKWLISGHCDIFQYCNNEPSAKESSHRVCSRHCVWEQENVRAWERERETEAQRESESKRQKERVKKGRKRGYEKKYEQRWLRGTQKLLILSAFQSLKISPNLLWRSREILVKLKCTTLYYICCIFY